MFNSYFFIKEYGPSYVFLVSCLEAYLTFTSRFNDKCLFGSCWGFFLGANGTSLIYEVSFLSV